MSQFKTKRLSKDENKSNNSYQNNLSPDEIKEKLEEYKRVDDISTVSLNAHLRYFIINEKTGEKQFRLGGFLTKIDIQKGYIVLSNGNLSWSVQLKNSIFFKKMSFQELKQELVEDSSYTISGKKYASMEEAYQDLKSIPQTRRTQEETKFVESYKTTSY